MVKSLRQQHVTGHEGGVEMDSASTAGNPSGADPGEPGRLPREVYAALEDIVGGAFVSEDDFVTASHDWAGLGADPGLETLKGKPPGAVVLPATTEEVAAVVKLCNRYSIKFKAHSTGYGNYAGVMTHGSVSIDLRRMDSIEIDPESRMAIIEPYATAGRLMAEANRYRLMTHIIGAGPIHSPLASATSFAGMGVGGNHTSNNSRNLLALEWVTPEGDIVRIGSSGSGAGWFTGEGPGPGFRGVIRGVKGAAGALGVFTKIGYKLYPWAGPRQLEWTGVHPQRGIAPPKNFATYQLNWKDWDSATEATRQLVDSKVGTFMTRTPPAALGNFFSATNREYYDRQRAGDLSAIETREVSCGWTVTTMSWSDAEHAWKQSVLNDILERTGGTKVELTALQRDMLTANTLVSMYITRFNRMGDGAAVSLGVLDSIDLIPKAVAQANADIDGENEPGGHFLQTDTEQNWMWLSEGRHFWTENNPSSTRFNAKNIAATLYMILRSFTRMEKRPIGINFFLGGPAYDIFGQAMSKGNEWMRKTKTTWDPQNLSDSADYTQPEPPKEAKGAWILKNILMHRWMKSIAVKLFSSQFK